MNCLSEKNTGKKMVDKVFLAAVKAQETARNIGENNVINATLGTLYDESGSLVTLQSIWSHFDTLSIKQKAKYASGIQGNPHFRKAVGEWLFSDYNIPHEVIATPGGAGAVYATIKNTLDSGQVLIKPSLAWGPYTTMARENGLDLVEYNLFIDDHFDIQSFKTVTQNVMKIQKRVVVIINDPCHNPSGYTMTEDEWEQVWSYLKSLSLQGPVVLLLDIAYADFTNQADWKKQLLRFHDGSENLLTVIAFSLSKTLTAYGMRTGAAIAIHSNQQILRDFRDALVYTARSTWSTVNNAMMDLFTNIVFDEKLKHDYLKEKEQYIKLLQKRSDIFITEAKKVGLKINPYKEGFFVTIPGSIEEIQSWNKKLQEQNIFLVDVGKGLRIALCSVPTKQLPGLAKRIYDIIN
jgi:aspartate aminotransferase/aromatic-amino-acid transaminase